MHSSISSFERAPRGEPVRPGFVRLTASDRPGVAQPVPERDIPLRPWRSIWVGAAILSLLLIGAWEWHWRAYGVHPGYRNSNGEWALQRRRIDHGEGGKTVLLGSSRVLFDVQLPVWQAITGKRPIQLAMEGTTPLPMLEDLAADPNFTGRLLVGVAPDIFFSGFAYRGDVLSYARRQTPSQRIGNWLSMHFIEPYLAFDDPDFALDTVIKRQPWPVRAGMRPHIAVRKLMESEADRNSHMWSKLVTDADYRALARRIWAQEFTGPPPPQMDTPAKAQQVIDEQIARAAAAVATLRARGVQVLFLRAPSIGPYYAFEEKVMPRARTWDVLLRRTHAPGIHFKDYPQLQGYDQPEWSHLTAPDAKRFTAALVPIVESYFHGQPAQEDLQAGVVPGRERGH
ncbi:MAG: hypothetical protein KGJ97_01855 [Xanthomonadaceae bacterium]|nr:hypothetical protein [Xanthomonadaceae bacterium]MDE3072417.1 hypothetical protein [Pseudomonadota bacterium]